ncbi:hypothetical protein [Sphingomonas oligophenolica]|uniref:Tetratricopeptide repeat protein n=1 Tax=Sphingomonas oligophenolica TaxID=301154 RepID=A0A502CHX7_9SPHN|nr:hypothetical protein [Sphingomonas oligophenolica]TPG12204.1 hypothetical protein EAH84_10165 [Sphingomonas oligophenolica]
MLKFSTLAMAALLATSASGLMIAAPATAQKNKKDDKPGFKLSKPVVAVAAPAQTAIRAASTSAIAAQQATDPAAKQTAIATAQQNIATAEPLVGQVEAAATTDDDKYVAAALRYDFENLKLAVAQAVNPKAPIDETVLAKPLDALIASASTPQADKAKYIYRRGILAFNGGQYPVAIQYLTQAKQAGYTDPNLDPLIIKAKLQGGNPTEGLADLNATLKAQEAAGQKPTEEYYRYAIAKSNQQKNVALTVDLLQRYIAAYPTPKNWREVLFTYGLQKDSAAQLDQNQRLDAFRLMRQTNALADQYDYEEYGNLAYTRGLPTEAQSVVKAGLASGKIPASSSVSKQLVADSATAIRNEGALSSSETKAKASKDGKVAAQTADAYLGDGNNAKAIELYNLALTKGGVTTDEVNLHLGIAQARSGDKAGAMASFDKVTGQPRAAIAGFWKVALNSKSVG